MSQSGADLFQVEGTGTSDTGLTLLLIIIKRAIMFEQVKPTRKAAELLIDGDLGLICILGKSYIPDCYLEIKITPSTTFIKIRNNDGVVVAKTAKVKFPKKWRESFDTTIGPVAYEITVVTI